MLEESSISPDTIAELLKHSIKDDTVLTNTALESRKNKRVKASLACVIVINIDDKKCQIQCKTVDISTGGIGIITEHNFDLSKIGNFAGKVDFILNGTKEAVVFVGSFVGKVLSTNNLFRYSIKFEKIDESKITLFKRFIEDKIKKMSS